MFVSPKHIAFGDEQWTLDELIDLFYARIDGWHLEIADRCINGWYEEGEPCITATDLQGRKAHYVPDSGWAVLQIVFSYFETIAFFKLGATAKKWNEGQLFIWGIVDTFPNLTPYRSAIKRIVWGQLRTHLYHTIGKTNVLLRHSLTTKAIEFSLAEDVVIIDPHLFVAAIRQHFRDYCTRLHELGEIELRTNFEYAFSKKYR